MRGKTQVAVLTVGLALATLAAPLPAAAGPVPSAPAPAKAPAPLPAQVRTATVTLVTGDVVRLTTGGDGRQSVTVQRGPATGHQGFQTITRNGHTHVIPDVAGPYLASGRLDERLFDVTALVDGGYDDAARTALPLIVDYGGHRTSVARTRALLAQPVPAGARAVRTLPSVGVKAVAVDKRSISRFWEAVDDDRTPSALRAAKASPVLAAGIGRLWLDGPVRASLDRSVPQIGAPAAWRAGYDGTGVTVAVLDTGIAATHPDLEGRVAESANFSDAASVEDKHGHGTHVASTVVGSGAASGGRYTGVAPGARLAVGKVLNDSGSGLESWVMAGMEWAAARARVVNMSLGGGVTDGTDPQSQAVNRLSAATGALFVIAAGNNYGRPETVASPGAADAALTVGAVDRGDSMAGFASRGPRIGDHAVKPEISAPGVGIVAARIGGGKEQYVGASGTSMASPHVAGAAAILAQVRPDWTGQQLKATLTSTAAPTRNGHVYDTGAGRVDVARAVRQQVTASTGVLNLGRYTGGYGQHQPVRRTVTYRNSGSAAVTLDLQVSAATVGGKAVAADVLGVSPASLTVPAGGSADATVTLDVNRGDLGLFSGRLLAADTAGGTALTAAVGFSKELRRTLTLRGIARDGRPAASSDAYLWNFDSGELTRHRLGVEPLKISVHQGRYLAWGNIYTQDAPGRTETELTGVVHPELTVDADAELTFDARAAKEVVARTPQPIEPLALWHSLYRKVGDNSVELGRVAGSPVRKLFAVPSQPPATGELEYVSRLELEKPVLTLQIVGSGTVLHPTYLTPWTAAAKRLDGRRTLPAVYVGAGRPDDFAGRDVRGKVVLVRSTPGLAIESQVAAAAAARAGMVAVLAAEPGVFMPPVDPAVALPTVGLSQAESADLLRRLGQGPVTLALEGSANSPYRYDLVVPHQRRIPDNLTYEAGPRHTAVQDTRFSSVRPDQVGTYSTTVWRPYTWLATAVVHTRRFPLHQQRYYLPGDTTYSQSATGRPWEAGRDDLVFDQDRRFEVGRTYTKTFYAGPLASGTAAYRGPATRTGDRFFFTFNSFTDAEPDHIFGRQGERAHARVYRDGELVGSHPRYAIGPFDVGVEGPATYRVELDVDEGMPGWNVSPEVFSAWTFRSARPTTPAAVPLPVLEARWRLGLDLNNSAPAGTVFPLRLEAGTAVGAPPVPVRSGAAWVSFDDGGTWQRVPLRKGTGTSAHVFTGSVGHPALRDTTGYVSLRTEVTDHTGGKVEQTVIRAYRLH